jgi:hypothetical protein
MSVDTGLVDLDFLGLGFEPRDDFKARMAKHGAEWRNGDWHTIEPSPALVWCSRDDWTMPSFYRPKEWPDPAEIARLGEKLDAVDPEEIDRAQRRVTLACDIQPLFDYYIAMRRFAWFQIVRQVDAADDYEDLRRSYETVSKLGSGATMRQIIDTRAALEIASAANARKKSP